MIDINELRRLAQAALIGPDGVSMRWLKLLKDFQEEANPSEVLDLLDRLEAAEKERDALRAEVQTWQEQAKSYWSKIAAMERQLYALPGAQPVPSVPDGWKLVPIEPTPEMIRALIDGANQYDSWNEGYRDMLAAAPEAKS